MIAPRRLWLADAAGHSVDLLPVDLNAAPYRGSDGDAPVFSAGVVGGEPVPCLSEALQVYQRGQFSTRSVDLHDMRMLGANAETAARTDLRSSVGRAAHRVAQRAIPRAETVLLVPVSLPLGVLPPRPHNWLRRAIPFHVTLLYPFVPPGALNGDIVAAVEGVLRGHHAFSFSLTGVRSFTNARYFVIEPQQPFVELIGDCQRAWPEYPRYGGEFLTIIPHVTIAQGRRMNRVDPGIEARLPVQVVARHVEIWRNDVIRGWVRHSLLELPRER